ncbi:MAG: hypothetical protein COX31_01525 [Candidatus Moranbacteria bacterium CG23_combo_of_CG06-09_8_20_14_all_40_16]|nr:MAG: hypothetical protein COX31_01525 [Candidatus Moranbacteria bacterium CG23_combo_of_CG06-09_8_20_14_all_40_16]
MLVVRLRRIFRISRGDFLAACGGKECSNYFQNRAQELKIYKQSKSSPRHTRGVWRMPEKSRSGHQKIPSI